MSAALAAARRRHPCMRAPVPAETVRHRIVDELWLGGAAHPEVAAAVLAVRGATGLDQCSFARRAGVDVVQLQRAEAGDVPRDQLPGALRRMVPVT